MKLPKVLNCCTFCDGLLLLAVIILLLLLCFNVDRCASTMNFYFDGRMKDEGREVSGVVRAVALPECAHQNPAFVIKYVS